MGGGSRGGVEGEGGGQAEGEVGESTRGGEASRARPRGGTLDADEWDPDSPCEFKDVERREIEGNFSKKC